MKGQPLTPIRVDHEFGDRFTATIRGHAVIIDQPVDDGGTDAGPTPTELFIASLASCVAFYARRYLARHNIAADGLRVSADSAMASDRPNRVGAVDLTVVVPADLTPGQLAALKAVVEHCTVHNSILRAPAIALRVKAAPVRSGAGLS